MRTQSHRLSKVVKVGATVVVFGLVAGACGSDKNTDTTEPSSTTTTEISGEKPVIGGTLNMGLESAVSTLDPTAALAQPADKDVALAIYDPLVSFDEDGKFIPYLAKSVTASFDLKTWTVVLNPNIKFSDNTPLNADAVIAHWQRMIKPANKSQWQKTAAQHGAPTKTDDLTLVFNMSEPYVGFINDIAGSMGYIPSPTAVAADPKGFGLKPVGSGPFILQSFETGGKIVVKKNPSYWKKDKNGNSLPYLDGINFIPIPESDKRLQALETGDIDLMQTADTSTVVAAEEKGLQIQKISGSSSTIILLNTGAEPTNNRLVRQALSAATDRQAINEVVYKGARVVALSGYAPDSPYRNPEAKQPSYDPEAAKQLLAEYGQSVSIILECIATPEAKQITQLIKENWEAVGVTVTLKEQEQGAYVARLYGKKGDYQAACFRSDQFVDPDQLRSSIGTNGTSNLTLYSNRDVDNYLIEGKSSADFETRKAAYFKIQEIIAVDVPTIFTLYDLFGNVYDADKVGGLPTPEGTSLGAVKLAYVYKK